MAEYKHEREEPKYLADIPLRNNDQFMARAPSKHLGQCDLSVSS